MMTRTVQLSSKVTSNIRKSKAGRVEKKNGANPAELKSYKLNELSALQKKLEKVDVKLELGEEKDNGRSIIT